MPAPRLRGWNVIAGSHNHHARGSRMRKLTTALIATTMLLTGLGTTAQAQAQERAAPVGALAVNTEHVQAVSAINSVEPKSATAQCPAGMVVTGGGFSTATGVGNDGSVVMDELIIRDNFVTGTAYEDVNGTSANWGITVIAVCANPLPGYEIKLGRSAN